MSADDLYWEEVEEAHRIPPEERLLEGPRLFDRACRIMADSLRAEFPDAGDEEVADLLRRRLELLDRLEGRS